MPAWVHDRAQHLLAKNPNMPKSMAFALATDQGHATGKTPKKYGTLEGRKRAKQKYDKPRKEYVKTPNPGNLETPKLESREKTAMYDFMKQELLEITQGSQEKTASGCVIDFDNDGNRMGVEWHEDALARIMGLPRTSGSIMGKTGAARWVKELGDPAVLRGMKARLKSVIGRTHEGSNYGDYVKEQGTKTLDMMASRGKGGTGPAGGSLTRGLRKQLNPGAVASNKGSIDDLVNANASAQQVSKRKHWMQPKEFRNQKTSSVKLSAMKEAFKRSYYHGTGPWGPTFMKTDKMPDPSRVAQSQMPAQQAIENMSGKVAGAAITPAARLATSMQVGRPPAALSKVGPSVAQVGKIKGPGSGTALPGAKEGGSV